MTDKQALEIGTRRPSPAATPTKRIPAFLRRHPATLLAVLLATCLWTALVAIGYSSGLEFEVQASGHTKQAWNELVPIFLTNASAALGLYSGVLTAGISTFASSVLLGLFTGAVFHGASDALGTGQAIMTLGPYFVFEGFGLLLASIAGFMPITAIAIHWLSRGPSTWRTSITTYISTVQRTLMPLTVSLALIAVGAVMEVLGGIPQ